MEDTINKFIDKLHFRSYEKVIGRLKEEFPDVRESEFRDIMNHRLKDKYIKTRRVEPYYVKIYSSSPNCWFQDILDNGKGSVPRYWMMYIGTNNHYAVAYELHQRTKTEIRDVIQRFINDYHPSKLTSDEEGGFVSDEVLRLLKENRCNVQIVSDKNHSSLGIIDRLIRTLRDMNTPHEHSKRFSNDKKYRSFTPDRMRKLLDIYNSTYHSRIKCSPIEMLNDPELEKEYIFNQIKLREKREEKLKDFKLNIGSFVRYILPRSDGITKKRYQISPECYKIEEKSGNNYVLIARDGTIKTLPRYRIMLASKNGEKPRNCKWGDTFGNNSGIVRRLIEYYPKTKKYRVAFEVPEGEEYIDTIPESYINRNYPNLVRTMKDR